MLKALDENGNQVLAWRAGRFGKFICPECNEPVVYKCGEVVRYHFAHYPKSKCPYFIHSKNTADFYRHEEMKMQVGELARNLEVDYEVALVPDRRADVVITFQNNVKAVVECQNSPISIDEFEARTKDYNAGGYPVLWLWDIDRVTAFSEIARVNKEVAYCHYVSFGRVYYLTRSGMLMACHYNYVTKTTAKRQYQESPLTFKLLKTSKGLNLIQTGEGIFWTPKKRYA